jgi:hypothetical protein
MNVGLRAFLVIADSLAQNEEEPMMPLHNSKSLLKISIRSLFIF